MAMTQNGAPPKFGGHTSYRNLPVAASEWIYRGAAVGVNPAGYAQEHVPGLTRFIGFADHEFKADTTDGARCLAGTQTLEGANDTIRVTAYADNVQLAVSGAVRKDIGKYVYATDDATFAYTGCADSIVGRVIDLEASGYVIVEMRNPGQRPAGARGSYHSFLSGHEPIEPTGAVAGDGWLGSWEYETILGPGFVNNDEEDGGFEMEFDTTDEVALSSIRFPNDILPVDKGLRLSFDVNITNNDKSWVDFDIGFGTALTTNSEANIDHADMVQLIALHIDGDSLNILVQSDNNTTDVAATDSLIDYAEGTPFHVDICVSPAGLGKVWIDGVDAGNATHANVTLQVLSTALLAPFFNLEKTAGGAAAVFRAVVRNIEVVAGAV